ncbi:MAG TPA: hypothetical protein VIM41_01860 [Gammaproteobacteria bacterium]
MPRVVFTENLKRYIDCPPQQVDAATVREALAMVFASYKTLLPITPGAQSLNRARFLHKYA